jgi:PKD repeat protein
MSKAITGPKKCVEDLDAAMWCSTEDLKHCYNFACNVDECYTECTASDAECASGYACSSTGTQCLTDVNGDGIADVEETVTITTATCDGPSQSEINSTVLGTVVYTVSNETVTTVSDTCEGNNLYQVFCNAGSGYTARYGPLDCTTLGAGYTCWDGVCVVSTTSANQAPVAACGGFPSTGIVGESLEFDAAFSYDPDGAIADYYFDYGDGYYNNSGVAFDTTHAYTSAGTYTVTLTVTDEHGAIGSCSQDITVTTLTTTHSCATNDASDCEEGYVCQSSTACYISCTINEYGVSTGCADEYTCLAGACVESTETCTDSDGGYDIYEAGTITKGTSTYTDSCSSIFFKGKLTEYWCSNDEIKSSSGLNCAITAFPVCYLGACVECNDDTDCDTDESCDTSTYTCEAVDYSYSESKLTDDYLLFKLADLSGHYESSSGYLTSLSLQEGVDYTTSNITHVSIGTSGSNNYLSFMSSSTPRYISFEDMISKPTHWLKVAADVKVDSASLSNNQLILAQLTSTKGSQLYALLTKNGKYVFKISIDNTVYEVECIGYGPDTTWQEVVGLYTGKHIEIYVEGKFCGQSPASGEISSSYPMGDFVIGYSTLSESMQFKGYLDDIYIYGE